MILPLPLLLLLLSPFLFCHVAAGPAEEANRLMILLKTAIELNNINSLSGFVTKDFIYDTCNGILNYDKFLGNLRDVAEPPVAISTNWSTRDAQINGNVLQFTLHHNDQHPVAYADIQFEGRHFGNNVFMLTKGKSMACRS